MSEFTQQQINEMKARVDSNDFTPFIRSLFQRAHAVDWELTEVSDGEDWIATEGKPEFEILDWMQGSDIAHAEFWKDGNRIIVQFIWDSGPVEECVQDYGGKNIEVINVFEEEVISPVTEAIAS